jgi:hypothetical protein
MNLGKKVHLKIQIQYHLIYYIYFKKIIKNKEIYLNHMIEYKHKNNKIKDVFKFINNITILV